MALEKLSARKAKTAGPGNHEDGGGLRLVVSATGGRKWVLRFTLGGKRREMGLGSYPTVGLAKARQEAAKRREQIAEGMDPIREREAERAAEKVAAEGVPTFTRVAAQFIRAHRRGWSNRKHARQWVSTLKTYARPIVGETPVDQITTEDLLAILKPIWQTRTETAKRVQGRIENVLDYAAAMKWRDPINPARWRGHLNRLLPSPSKVSTPKHHPAMPYTAVPAFMAELRKDASQSSAALQLLILTATRTSETLHACWHEFDLKGAIWTIPPERMKSKREHRVPLSDAALVILASVPRIDESPHLFPGMRPGRPMSNMAMLVLMRAKGYGTNGERGHYVPHGFRSTFRDWAEETTAFPFRVCEAALAHVVGDKTVAAYQRGDLFEKRRKLMDAWSAYLGNQGHVIKGRFGAGR